MYKRQSELERIYFVLVYLLTGVLSEFAEKPAPVSEVIKPVEEIPEEEEEEEVEAILTVIFITIFICGFAHLLKKHTLKFIPI